MRRISISAPSPLVPEGRAAGAPEAGRTEELGKFERLLADLSARFVNLPAAEVDGAILDALRRIVELLGVDRAQLIRFSTRGDEARVTHSWAMQGVPTAGRISVSDTFPWAFQRIRDGVAVVVPRVDDLPAEAALDRARWQLVGVRSNLTMPMNVGEVVEGALALGCLRHEREWPTELIARVEVLADVFANALAHKRAREELDAAMDFERTVSDSLAALLKAGRADEGRVIESTLRDIARVFGVDRATLWQRVGDSHEFEKTHRWIAEGVRQPPDRATRDVIPWISAQLVAGSTVRFARHADLPPEAAADLPALSALDVRAGVIVPLAVAGSVVGALSLASVQEDPGWLDALVPRVKLVGEVLAAVLARHAAERREREAQLQAMHSARVATTGVFAASLLHEVTQPVAASLANAETAADLLALSDPDLDELRAIVADIVADDRRAGDLVQQLRRFLRKGEVERTELDVHDLLAQVLRVAGRAAGETTASITLEAAEALPKIIGDRVQLQQVLLNLVLNALDAVADREPGSRRIALRASPFEDGIRIEVTDSGCGMDDATLARIFEPFFTTKPRGLGLGLSISGTIVASHGGALSARSVPGQGTTFRLELPLQPPGERHVAPRENRRETGAGTVFVIDDDPSMRRALERQLASAGYHVEAFASAQDYMQHRPHGGPACIVSDVRMPGLSGLDLQAALARRGADVPMVFVSGHGDVPMTVRAMKGGAVNFLAKPFSKDQLLAAVAEALALSRETEAVQTERVALQGRYESLTPRERDVFALVASGLLNKLIADRLNAAEATVKIHRGRVMEKMGAASLADLVRMSERLGLPAARASPDA